jgi:hypothetical protein
MFTVPVPTWSIRYSEPVNVFLVSGAAMTGSGGSFRGRSTCWSTVRVHGPSAVTSRATAPLRTP